MLESRALRSIASVAVLAASIAVAGSRAQAQVDGGAAQPFVVDDFFIALNGPDGNRLTTTEVSHFFNLPRCNCRIPIGIYVALLQSGLDKRAGVDASAGTVSFVLGKGCNNSQAVADGTRMGTCQTLGAQSASSFLQQGQVTFQTDAQQLSVPYGFATIDGGATGPCVAPTGMQFTQTINVNFDFDNDGAIDVSVPDQTIIDLAPPPAPSGLTVQRANEALVVNWTKVPSSVTDLLGYQVLCSRADQFQVFKETATDAGGATGPFTAAFVSCPDAQTGTGVEGVDPTFVCSPLLGASAASARLEVLQNGITYAAAVVAVDQSGNASESAVQFGIPVATASFYDTYRNGDPPGGATGGLCAIGPGLPSPERALGGLSLFAAVGGVLIRGRRRRRAGISNS